MIKTAGSGSIFEVSPIENEENGWGDEGIYLLLVLTKPLSPILAFRACGTTRTMRKRCQHDFPNTHDRDLSDKCFPAVSTATDLDGIRLGLLLREVSLVLLGVLLLRGLRCLQRLQTTNQEAEETRDQNSIRIDARCATSARRNTRAMTVVVQRSQPHP